MSRGKTYAAYAGAAALGLMLSAGAASAQVAPPGQASTTTPPGQGTTTTPPGGTLPPGVPNTGAGGDAAANVLLLGAAGGLALASTALLWRRRGA